MVTAVDTSVLLDVLLNDRQHAPASIAALHREVAQGPIINHRDYFAHLNLWDPSVVP